MLGVCAVSVLGQRQGTVSGSYQGSGFEQHFFLSVLLSPLNDLI